MLINNNLDIKNKNKYVYKIYNPLFVNNFIKKYDINTFNDTSFLLN